jgi:hypothetical protein
MGTSTRVLAVTALVLLVTVEQGGSALLTFITGRKELSDAHKQFFRAGHAHAGVLLVLSLVYFIYLGDTSLSRPLRWIAGFLLLAGILMQAGGFFLHMARGVPEGGSAGTRLTRSGAVVLAAAILLLAVGLATV